MNLSESSQAAFSYLLAVLLPLFAVAVFCTLGSETLSLTVVPAVILGLLLLAGTVLFARRVPIGWTGPVPSGSAIFVGTVIAGLAGRILFSFAVHPAELSDMASYDFSARHLLTAHEYVCREGDNMLRAYRPPGVAFLLAAVMSVTGPQAWSPLLLNCILYIGTSFFLWQALRSFPRQASLFALLMLALWPSELNMAGLPQSETPTIFFSAALIWVLSCIQNQWTKVVLLGLFTGISCLLRNSNLLLIAIWWFVLLQSPVSLKKRIAMSLLVVAAAFAPILPWTVRNAHILGTPVLVATNGGSNFYAANNSRSSGGWEATSEIELHAYLPDEVAMDKAGFKLAKQWIREHPLQFGRLGVEKVRLLLGSDDWGPYWAFTRGRGYTGSAYQIDFAAAGVWWVVLWSAVLIGFVRQSGLLRQSLLLQAVAAFTLLPAFLFFIFQSQSRYHAFMVPGLLFLGARMNSFLSDKYASRASG